VARSGWCWEAAAARSWRLDSNEVPSYVGAQVLGGLLAGAVIYVIASGAPGFHLSAGFAANGYGPHSPAGYGLRSALVCEVVLSCGFLVVIMGATDAARTPAAFGPIAIGLTLTLIHLISIPVTNTSVNPARSTGVALFAGGWALRQLWLFWVAPLLGGALGGLGYRALTESRPLPVSRSEALRPPPGGIIPGARARARR